MKINLHILLLLLLFSTQFIASASPDQLNQQPEYNCASETTPLIIKIEEMNQIIKDLKSNLTNCQNISEYYKMLYEGKEVNITHRELIQIFNNLNNFDIRLNQTDQTVNEIKNEINLFTFKVSISIAISVAIIELIFYFRRKKEKENE